MIQIALNRLFIGKIAWQRPRLVIHLSCINLFSTPDRLQFLDEKILSFAQIGKGLGVSNVYRHYDYALYNLSVYGQRCSFLVVVT